MKTIKSNIRKSKLNVGMNKKIYKKFLLVFAAFMATTQHIFAVDGQITTWGTTVETALNAAVGVFAIVGGFIVFIQYMQGNDSAQKNFIKFVIGLAIFGLSALIAQTFIP